MVRDENHTQNHQLKWVIKNEVADTWGAEPQKFNWKRDIDMRNMMDWE